MFVLRFPPLPFPWSERQASLEAVGGHELVRDMRRGRTPSVERLQALCEVLDLEFYVGPRREAGTIDEQRLEDAVDSTERTLETQGIALETRAEARAIVAVSELLDRERKVPGALAHVYRAPCEGAVPQRVRIPPGNCRSSR